MKETIKKLREDYNFSQSYVASYLKISRQMYIKYELGEVEPPIKVVVALSKLYNISYAQIIDNEFNSQKEVFSYKIKQDTDISVASPANFYGTSSQKPVSSQLEIITAMLKNLPEESLAAVSAFLKILQSEQILIKKTSQKSKKAFFDLAGKITLDSDSVTEFREASFI
ncbi:MAG: helix-turn-helix transcriptional regulator [Spirochaetaceae bacterium]|nr:helix-turn-helix transcriptional regulator [Spirochaetaceae bacterium]